MARADVRRFVNGRLQADGPEPAAAAEPAPAPQEAPAAPSVEDLVSSRPFVAISVGNCPQCEELASFLSARGVPDTVFVKWDRTDPAYPSLKASLAVHAGEVFTFPQVFAGGVYQGGLKDVLDKANAGAYDDLFEREFGAQPETLKRWVDSKPMAVFSLPNCPQCDVLREELASRGVPVGEVFIKLDKAAPEYATLKAQLVKLVGRDKFTFPQTFVKGAYQGGFEEVLAQVQSGELAGFFEEAFNILAQKPQEGAQQAQAPLSFDDDF